MNGQITVDRIFLAVISALGGVIIALIVITTGNISEKIDGLEDDIQVIRLEQRDVNIKLFDLARGNEVEIARIQARLE